MIANRRAVNWRLRPVSTVSEACTEPAGVIRNLRSVRTLQRVRRRLDKTGLLAHLLGLWLRRHFQRAGIVAVVPGLPLPAVQNLGRIEVENCAFYPGVRIECWKDALIRIGNGTYLNRGVEIVAASRIVIGRDCKIARDVIIMDSDQHPLPAGGLVAKPVTIEDRAWIGARAIILKGVTIGHDAVVGAGSVVNKDVQPGAIVAGVPARLVRQTEA
jgi:acetyltransferase-like isoleucine patch superfamily enzyme